MNRYIRKAITIGATNAHFQMVITKHFGKSAFTLIAVLAALICCLVLANSAWLLTPFWAWLRLNQLRGEMSAVPSVANTTLVDRIEGMFPSGVSGCATVYIYELRGSNGLSLTDAYREFGTALPPEVQRTRVSSPSGNGYDWKKDVSLEVSSYAAERDILPFGSTRSEAAESNYTTLFVIGLNQPVYPDNYNKRCH